MAEWSPYPDPNRPPPAPDASVSRQHNPLGRALAKALTSLAEDDDLDIDDSSYALRQRDRGGGKRKNNEKEDSDDCSTKRVRKRPIDDNGGTDSSIGETDNDEPARSGKVPKLCVDDQMKEQLLQSFGDALAKTEWYGQDNAEEGKPPTIQSAHSTPNAPSGLLRGKVKHYNRFGRQWRILVEDVEIRPRVRLEKDGRARRRGHQKRSERQSLWDRSVEYEEEQIQAAGTHEAAGGSVGDSAAEAAEPSAATASTPPSNDSGLHSLDIKGNTLRVRGDVLILAYDDV